MIVKKRCNNCKSEIVFVHYNIDECHCLFCKCSGELKEVNNGSVENWVANHSTQRQALCSSKIQGPAFILKMEDIIISSFAKEKSQNKEKKCKCGKMLRSPKSNKSGLCYICYSKKAQRNSTKKIKKMKLKTFKCFKCGKEVDAPKKSRVVCTCCGRIMRELEYTVNESLIRLEMLKCFEQQNENNE